MQRIIELTIVRLKHLPRNRGVMFGTLLFPLIFIGVFGIAFQQGAPENRTYQLAIVNEDLGIPDGAIVYDLNGSELAGTALVDQFIDLLGSIEYEDNETKVFSLRHYDIANESQAIAKVQEGDFAAILYLPQDFSIGVMAAMRAQMEQVPALGLATNNWNQYPAIDYETDLQLRGDVTMQAFGIVAAIVDQVVDGFFAMGQQQPDGNALEIDGSIATNDLTGFDYILPGLIIFGLMQGLSTISAGAMRDVESGLLRRIKITNVKGYEYTISLILSQLVISLVQIPIMFGTAMMFGFPFSADVLNAFVFAILISLSMTGIGLIIAGTLKTTDAANNAATMVSVPMAFLAGAFFDVPNPTLIEAGGILGDNSFGIMDLLPPTTAIKALRLILIGSKSLVDVWYYLLVLTILSLSFLAVGIIIYSRKHLTAEK